MLSVDVIQGIRIFMDRVQLQGREVQAYNRVMMALYAEEQGIVDAARQIQEASARANAQSEDSGKIKQIRPVGEANAT